MSRRRGHGQPRRQLGMPRARDLRDGVTGLPLKNVRNPATTISQGYRGRDVLAGKNLQLHPRDLWAMLVDDWMTWNCADCHRRIPRNEVHLVHRLTGNHRCIDCHAVTYPE